MSNPLVNIVIKKAGLTPTRDTGKKYAADLGKSIISQSAFEDGDILNFDVEHLSSGIYFVDINFRNTNFVRQIIIR